MFDFSIDLNAVYNSVNGNFVIQLHQVDDETLVSGVASFSGNTITCSPSFDVGGYSFIGIGVK